MGQSKKYFQSELNFEYQAYARSRLHSIFENSFDFVVVQGFADKMFELKGKSVIMQLHWNEMMEAAEI